MCLRRIGLLPWYKDVRLLKWLNLLMARVRILQVAASCLTGMFLLAPLGSKAQITGIQVQAANVARMRAESLNGGLSKYFAANCMHERGGGDCLIKADNQGFLFRFAGGPPLAGKQTTAQPRLKLKFSLLPMGKLW